MKSDSKPNLITADKLVALGGTIEGERVRFGNEVCFEERGSWQLGTHQGLRTIEQVESIIKGKAGGK